jgi:UDP-GlcNAc:undecaprenyl-phosphate/decaprenyl-phosphate GlcNAc-1-phosphate transferase
MIPDASLAPTTWAAIAAWTAGLAAVLIATPALSRLAWATGYLDHPEARKLHIAATPLLGGLAVALGTALGANLGFWSLDMGLPQPALWWMAGAVVAVTVGLIDDRFGMGPAPKLFFQALAAWLFLQGDIYPQRWVGPIAGQLISIVWMVGLMNAINFLDNMDGIVGGVSAICALAFAALLALWGQGHGSLFALGLAGAALGFLRYNFAPARIFLGDTGSLFLGYTLGALGLIAASTGPGVSGVLASLLVLGYPLFDTCFVVFTRLYEGRKVYIGGRDHTTHRTARILGSTPRTAMWVYAATALMALSGVLLGFSPGATFAIPLVAGWAIVLIIVGRRLARVPQL